MMGTKMDRLGPQEVEYDYEAAVNAWDPDNPQPRRWNARFGGMPSQRKHKDPFVVKHYHISLQVQAMLVQYADLIKKSFRW